MTIQIFFDGATGPKNPGHGGAGWAIYFENKPPIGSYMYLGPDRTNNEAEYAALIYSLLHGIELGINNQRVDIYGVSQLVIKQVNSEWKNKQYHLQTLMDTAHNFLSRYTNYNLRWIPREYNSAADRMSVMALNKQGIRSMR